MQNIFDGVIWFALPVLLVCSNDTFAYIVGFFFGKRFIPQPLTNLSVSSTQLLQSVCKWTQIFKTWFFRNLYIFKQVQIFSRLKVKQPLES